MQLNWTPEERRFREDVREFVSANLPADTRIRTVASSGTIGLDNVRYKVDPGHAFEQVLVIADGTKIVVTDLHGEILAEHTRPAPGIHYVGSGRPPGTRPKNPETSPKS